MISGFKKYSEFIVKRERIMSFIWIVSVVVLTAGVTAMYPGLFPTEQDLMIMAQTMNTPAMIALMGSVYGMESLTPAMIMAQHMSLWIMVSLAVMNIFFVNRHTRGDEELGRLEVLRSLPTGRLTNSVSTIVCAVALNIIIALLTAIGIMAVNISGTDAAGAFAYSFAICAVGILFSAIALLAAQIFTTSRDALTAGFAVLGLFYVLRAVGDMGGNELSYISPLGLGLKVESFYSNTIYPIVVLLVESAVIFTVALALCSFRDLGEGIIPARKGHKHASRFLKSPFGLAWRLTRNILFAWGIGMFAIGAVYGSVVGEIEIFVETNEMFKMMLEASGAGGSLVDNFLAMILCVMAIISSVPVVVIIMKIRSEEKRGRLEQVFSKSVSRYEVFACFIIISIVCSVVMLFLSAFGIYVTASSTSLVSLGEMMKASVLYIPAHWVFLGLSVFLVGVLKKLTALVWIVFTYSFFMLYFGRIFNISDILLKLSPFGSIPQLPVQEVTLIPLIILTFISVVLTTLGIGGFNRRDIY